MSWMLAASLGRVVGSLDDFFLVTIFLPCKEGRVKPRHGADHSPRCPLGMQDVLAVRASAWS